MRKFATYRWSATVAATTLLAALLAAVLLAAPLRAQSTEAAPVSSATIGGRLIDAREAEYAAVARDFEALERELGLVKRVVRLVTPAVVHIESTPLPRHRGSLRIEEAGSGVIVEYGARSYVLTNRHVIHHSSPELIEVQLADGRVLNPEQIWSDNETDVAVMAISAANLSAAKIGNSDSLEIGDPVLAVGSPFGLSQSVTRGIVSAKGRHNLKLGDGALTLQNFIQTDAAINPGNSGGPLVNLRGEIVGLNTAIASASGGNEGIGFSIPVNIVDRIARGLVEDNAAPRGYLGVELDDRFNEQRAVALGLSRVTGTRISRVHPLTPADRANLRVDDVILEYNGVRVERMRHLQSLVKLSDYGERVELVVLRDGKPFRTFIEIGRQDSPTVSSVE